MDIGNWLLIGQTILAVILAPLVVLFWRLTIRGTQLIDKVNSIEKDLANLVVDKDRVHQELYQSMREDREATNRRLRWLEEHLWRQGDTRRGRSLSD